METVKEDPSKKQYHYSIKGKPMDTDNPIQADDPQYFIAQDNFFTMTKSKELNDAIKKAFAK